MASGGDAHVSPERYVVSETSADDTPIALPPRCFARDRGTARMQPNQRSSSRPKPRSLKRKLKSSSSSSSSSSRSSASNEDSPPPALSVDDSLKKGCFVSYPTKSSANPHLLTVGTRVSPNLSQSPKEELVSMLRTNGHNPIQRSIRQGNILMICKDCGAKCRVSTYKNDAWCVTTRNDAVGRQCQKSADATTKVEGAPAALAKPAKGAPVPFPKGAPAAIAEPATSSLGDCSVCRAPGVVWCNRRHPYCRECFDHTVNCQVTGEGRPLFVTSGCKMCCPFCPLDQSPPSFVMHLCAPMLKESTFNSFQDCIVQQAVMAAEQTAEIRCAEKIKAYQQQHSLGQQQQLPDDIDVQQHVEHILDNVIRAKCPNKACGAYVGAFEACSAIQCTCNIYFCAWCLIEIEAYEGVTARTRCHAHVRECPFNPHRNVYPPSPHPQIWEGVLAEWSRKRVKDYIRDSGGVCVVVYGRLHCLHCLCCLCF